MSAVPVSSTPAVVHGVGVVVASDDGRVRFFGQDLERVFWETRLDRSVYSSVVVDTERDRFVVATTGGLVACIGLRGDVAWTRVLPEPVFSTPTILPERRTLVIGTFGSHCVFVDLDDGAVIADVSTPRPWSAALGGLAAHRDVYASPVVRDEDSVVVCSGDHVVAIGRDGTVLWSVDTGATIKASPVVVGDRVVVAGTNGVVRTLALLDAQEICATTVGARIAASPVVVDGVAVVGDQTGRVHGLDTDRLAPQWQNSTGAPRSYTSFSTLPDGAVIATGFDGDVRCIDPRDGAFRWQSSQVLGLPDHEPEMDITPVAAPDGSLYCASYRGDVYRFAFRPDDGGVSS
ncbi:PQQ-binding-like beta-propeller repeat protein [Curtobacterium sp. L3-7]|uniref:outer membrane protein assembly factor BamB family protein n=1 Tax=Curtobacterium sp. L3-7 TaxID=3138787 RepID=UPI003B520DC6